MSDDASLSPLKRAIVEIRDLKARLVDVERRQHEPIAIVGMGFRFPGGAVDPETFWTLLRDGVDAIGEVPAARWPIDEFYDPDPDTPGRMATRFGGFLPDVDLFDAGFFGISPREAESMDPQQRLLLEVAWEALEHAGIAADRLAGSRTGVFVGITTNDYFRMLLADREQIDTFTTTGNAASVGAGRLSYLLGLEGPSVALDTACSSSLVGVHMAVQSLRRGECDLAMAGGVGLILAPELTINFSRARMMASDGRCKTFDAAADGYVRSEGGGIVVLKRWSDAIADGDNVLAVVRGSAINQDGRSGGLTAPNGPAQEKVIAAALADAGLEPGAVSYVETHGTGTPLGDPIEVRAIGAVLCRERPVERPLLLGSVKTNVGHLEAAAGIASLAKVVLMLQHGVVPPHLHLSELNPHIAAERLPIAVPTVPTPWPAAGAGRIAGVSSFGLSGTNAHLIVGEAPPTAVPTSEEPDETRVTEARDDSRTGGAAPQLHVLTLSARSTTAVRALAERYADHLAEHPQLRFADVVATANRGRARLDHRVAVVASDRETAVARLREFAGGIDDVVVTGPPVVVRPDVAFVFTGHGSQHAGMGHDLYVGYSVFRAAIDRCGELLGGALDRSLTEILFADAGLLDDMRYAQPALLAFQFALTQLWQSWGVRPAVVAGHSGGEYAAAIAAGVLTLDDGLRLVTARGRLLHSLGDEGEMVAVFLGEDRVAAAVARHPRVGIAAVNGPATTVISGPRDAVEEVIADLELDDDDYRSLDISVAAHSPLVDPILDDFERAVRDVTLSTPRLGLVSSLTGGVVGAELTDPTYWRRHLREPVRFAAVFETMRAAGSTTFVEIGPHPTLIGLGRRCWPDDRATWVPSIERDGDERECILTSLATLHVAGVDVDWSVVNGDRRRTVHLPTYPWQRESYWAAAIGVPARPPATPTWPAVVAAVEERADLAPLDLHIDSYAARWAVLDRIATAAMARALRDLGLFMERGERHRVADLIGTGRFLPTYTHLAARWLGHLADDGQLDRGADGAFAAPSPLAEADIDALFAEAEGAHGDTGQLLAYLRTCTDNLSAVITGGESALATLFPDGAYDTVDFLYHDWSVARYFNGIVSTAIDAVVQARAGQRVRIVEVGAGTGGTSAAVLPSLPPDHVTYTFTDVSDFFLARAADRFAAYPFLDTALLDLDQEPEAHGHEPGSFDVVVASNVLHATRDLDATLRRIGRLLAPGGVLIAYETTRPFRWHDVTTGLIEGWQVFDDDWRDDSPLVSSDRWVAALASAGFAAMLAVPDAESAAAVLGQHVVLARAAGDESARSRERPVGESATPRQPGVGSADGAKGLIEVPTAAELSSSLAGALADERLDILVDFVRKAVGRVLRIRDLSRLRRDQPLLDLGFDSLMAVELRNVLRDGLALSRRLPATLVFDHPNIVAIARFIDRLLGAPAGAESRRPSLASAPAETIAAPVGADELAALTDEQVEAMLLEKLAGIEEP